MRPIAPSRDAKPTGQRPAMLRELGVVAEGAKAELPRQHVTKHSEDDMAADSARRRCAEPKTWSARAGNRLLACWSRFPLGPADRPRTDSASDAIHHPK